MFIISNAKQQVHTMRYASGHHTNDAFIICIFIRYTTSGTSFCSRHFNVLGQFDLLSFIFIAIGNEAVF